MRPAVFYLLIFMTTVLGFAAGWISHGPCPPPTWWETWGYSYTPSFLIGLGVGHMIFKHEN